MRDDVRQVWQWLARTKTVQPVAGVLAADGHTVVTGDALTREAATFWRQIWPKPDAQARQQAQRLEASAPPWPRPAIPEWPSLTPTDLRSAFVKMQSKASGPDAWSAKELMYLPDCVLLVAVRFLQAAEEDEMSLGPLLYCNGARCTYLSLLNPGVSSPLLDPFRLVLVGTGLGRTPVSATFAIGSRRSCLPNCTEVSVTGVHSLGRPTHGCGGHSQQCPAQPWSTIPRGCRLN